MQNTYTTVKFERWKEFKSFVDDLSENWAYRGQVNSKWVLKTAIERTEFIHLSNGIEIEFVSEFQRGARNYLSRDETPTHLIEWLALMQHHGAPTRLLDFSKSPYIAAYFAFEQCRIREDEIISVWAVNMHFLKKKSLEALAKTYAAELDKSKNVIDEELFSKIFFNNQCSIIFPVEPFRMNRRYSLQQSIFVSTGKAAEPFMHQLHFLGNDIERSVIKMEIPAHLKKEVLRDLQKMNLNRASLFPDLDGYASSLKYRYESMRQPDEINNNKNENMDGEEFNFLP